MFETIRPPTDNLYKFVAIFGLAVLLVSGWQRLQMDITFARAERETDARIYRLVQAVVLQVTDGRSGRPRPSEEEVAQLSKESWDEHYHMLELARTRWYANVGIGSGIVISVIGFALWYFKVQRHLDRLLQMQIVKEGLELRST